MELCVIERDSSVAAGRVFVVGPHPGGGFTSTADKAEASRFSESQALEIVAGTNPPRPHGRTGPRWPGLEPKVRPA